MEKKDLQERSIYVPSKVQPCGDKAVASNRSEDDLIIRLVWISSKLLDAMKMDAKAVSWGCTAEQ